MLVPAVKKPDRLQAARIGGVEDGDAVAEHVADVDVAAVQHHLHAVGPSALIAVGEMADAAADAGRRHVGVGARAERGRRRARDAQREQVLEAVAARRRHAGGIVRQSAAAWTRL